MSNEREGLRERIAMEIDDVVDRVLDGGDPLGDTKGTFAGCLEAADRILSLLTQAQELVGYVVRMRCDDMPWNYQETVYLHPHGLAEAEEDAEAMRHGPGDGWVVEVLPVGASPVAIQAEEPCPTCNASGSEPCAYPTENARRLMQRVQELEERLRASAPGEEREPGWKPDPCGICGGKRVTIRGQYPGCEDRLVCPTCLQERIDIVRKTLDPNTYRAVRATPTEGQTDG